MTGALPEPELNRLVGEVHECRLRAGHLLYDPEVTVAAVGLVRAFIGDGMGRQVTVSYLRPGSTPGLPYPAGRRYPTAFQAIENSHLVMVGNDHARQLHQAHAALGRATIHELVEGGGAAGGQAAHARAFRTRRQWRRCYSEGRLTGLCRVSPGLIGIAADEEQIGLGEVVS